MPGNDPQLSDSDLESLLARGRLPDARRERILANVLGEVARQGAPGSDSPAAAAKARPGWLRWRWPAGLGAAAGAAALIAVLAHPSPRSSRPSPSHSSDDGWQARGGGKPGPWVEVGCTGGTLDRCPAGSTLVFRVEVSGPAAYLAAYAEPLAPGGQRIWYFSGAQGALAPAGAPGVMNRGIRLGPEHAPGAYAVHLLVLRRPLPSAEILHPSPADVVSARTARLEVVP